MEGMVKEKRENEGKVRGKEVRLSIIKVNGVSDKGSFSMARLRGLLEKIGGPVRRVI
jgi:hypothetical protein